MATFSRALVLSFFMSALVAAQSSVVGDWSGVVQDDAGEHRVMLTLKVTDGVLTGSVIEPEGTEFSILEGSESSSSLLFNTAQQVGETRILTQWVGTVSGDEIAFSRAADNGSGTQTFTVRRN